MDQPEQQQPDPIKLAKALAVREAMFELVNEQRAEIIRRARAKLIAQGITVTDADVGMPL